MLSVKQKNLAQRYFSTNIWKIVGSLLILALRGSCAKGATICSAPYFLFFQYINVKHTYMPKTNSRQGPFFASALLRHFFNTIFMC